MSITYSFVVRDSGDPSGGTGLTPSFAVYRDIGSLADLSASAPVITEVGGGHYKFTVDWDTAPESTGPSNSIAVVIDAGAGISSSSERYVTARINRTDDFATSIDSSLTSIASGLTTIDGEIAVIDANVDGLVTGVSNLTTAVGNISTDVDTLINIETGKWEIVSDQLKLYEPDGVTLIKTFNLFASDGSPTSVAPAKRVPV